MAESGLLDDLLVELECPICTNYMSPPIRQCSTGHSVCEKCSARLSKCALCQQNFTDSRNLSLEGLAIKMRYPCINKALGCAARLAYTEREVHELKCPLSGYKCAMDKCPWIGKIDDLPAHWASKKNSSKPYNKVNVCHVKIKSDTYYINLVNAYNKFFWFKCKLTKNKLYWAVQLIGRAEEADKYYYEIDICKPEKKHKKILLSDSCQGLDIENSALFTAGTCNSISIDAVQSFATGEDQLLIYYFRIHTVKAENVAKPADAGEQPVKVEGKKKAGNANKQGQNPNKNKQKPKDGKDFVLV